VTQHHIIRICATGAECSGKTTLAHALGARFEAPVVEEYGREYFTAKMAKGDATVFAGDLVRVIGEQSRREDLAAATKPELMIFDTDVFTVAVWHERYLGGRRPEIDHLSDMRAAEGKGMDLYLLCVPEFPFVPDDIRSGEPMRTAMHDVFVRELKHKGYPYIEMHGSHQARVALAVTEIQRLLLAQDEASAR